MQPGHIDPTSTPEPKRPLLDRLKTRLDRQTARYQAWASRHKAILRTALALTILAAGYSGWFIYDVLTDLPGREEMRSLGDMSQATTIYDSSDRRLFTIPTEYRIEVPLSRISPNLIRALLAVEDQRFYDHEGVDGIRIIAAAFNDVRKRRAAEGGSTITQQLARQAFLSSDKTFRRKIKEAILAERIEHVYSKDEILGFYLNRVYFGDGLYGAEAAARGFFGKPAAELTVSEAALLAGLVKAPSTSNPSVSMERAIARRNLVLQMMRDEKVIDQAAWAGATAELVTLVDTLREEDPSGLHFKEQVRRQLLDQFGQEKVVDGGLRVFTTIDPEMQKAAEGAVAQALRAIEARGAGPLSRGTGKAVAPMPTSGDDRLQAALIAMDPRTGEVRAIVGGRDTGSPGINRAIQTKRQPGSAFKPFVYAAALESGYSPATIVDQLDQPIQMYKTAWLPDDHSTGTSMTMRAALRSSSNRAAVRMLEEVGIPQTVSLAQRLGLGSLPSVPSLALGAGEVTLMSMTSAYAVFANDGIAQQPIFIRRVEDRDGTVLLRAEGTRRRVLRDTTAFLMSSMLADVIDSGTASGARGLGFTQHAAGKTGTTNDFKDAWFVGYTPKLIAGVWVGFDQPRTIIKNGFAATLAVPLWTQFMKVATANDKNDWFDAPPGIVAAKICRMSGRLATPECATAVTLSATGQPTRASMVYTEYFVRGTDPFEDCPIHGAVPYDAATVGTVGYEIPAPPPGAPAPMTSPTFGTSSYSTQPPPLSPGEAIRYLNAPSPSAVAPPPDHSIFIQTVQSPQPPGVPPMSQTDSTVEEPGK